jgi:hypothetical protein
MSSGDIFDAVGEFLPAEHEPLCFEVLPPGKYNVVISDSCVCDTKAGTGMYLKLEFTVLSDEFFGRKLFSNLNIKNPSEKAEAMGHRELASVGQAVGLTRLRDSSELLDKTLIVNVKTKKNDYDELKNEINGYYPASTVTPEKKQMPPASETTIRGVIEDEKPVEKKPVAKPETKTKKMPWER